VNDQEGPTMMLLLVGIGAVSYTMFLLILVGIGRAASRGDRERVRVPGSTERPAPDRTHAA
jgi:hypothetical protein